MTSGQGKALGKAVQPAHPHVLLNIYMGFILFQLKCIVCWGADRAGA